jgi:hypothetical protein
LVTVQVIARIAVLILAAYNTSFVFLSHDLQDSPRRKIYRCDPIRELSDSYYFLEEFHPQLI